MSIALRLILGLAVALAVFWGATAVVTRSVLVDEIDEIITENMATTARRLMPLVLESLDSAAEGARDSDDAARELPDFVDAFEADEDGPSGFLAFEVRDAQGKLVLKSPGAEGAALAAAPRPGFVLAHGVLAFTLVDRASGIGLTVLEPGEHRSEAIAEATRALIWPLAWLLPLMAIAVLVLIRFSLAPLLGLSRQIGQRGGGNLTPLDPGNAPSELRPIIAAVDRLMERLRAALDAERVFAANSAHELRTPIAGALAQVQRLKAELTEPGAALRLAEVEARLKRLVDFAEKLLQLSRAEAGIGRADQRVNMTPFLAELVREFNARRLDPVRIEVDNQLGQDLMVAMDADAFAICLRNLLENAAIHGDRSQPIRVTIGQDWVLRVTNHGAIVSADVLATLTRRYARGDTSAKGSGLGLAITDTILRQSGGTLALSSPAPGQSDGFEASLALP